jgi:hypothetical protein
LDCRFLIGKPKKHLKITNRKGDEYGSTPKVLADLSLDWNIFVVQFDAVGRPRHYFQDPESSGHLKFPAIIEDTLFSDRPVLKDPSDGDIRHFYGPCDYDPVGREEVLRQRADLRRDRRHGSD